MAKKQRQHSRVKVSFSATMASGGRTIAGKIENVSLTGALIHCKELPNLSKRVELTIELPSHHYVISVHAKIIRLDIHDAGDGVPAYDIGVAFIDLSEEDLKFLSKKVLP
ncbi:MAG TPA: PilZ domain-containing protein [Syntrophobacteria bacterium]|nr:PilZ domain-containing protein [Syntrophobacteria bacterium]